MPNNDAKTDDNEILFPINQKEQASQSNAESLLATAIFSDLTDFLKASLENQPKPTHYDEEDIDTYRSHNAILIDGERGTGKSSILVNLPLYLKYKAPTLADRLLILKPVDPTLLENNDDLFLNVIVAAIIRNKAVAQALERGDHKAEAFHHQLQKLGHSLESLQSQGNQYGLDKLKAFMGNHGLVQQVHVLFKQTLELVGKQLLVLPIDDVDTSLNRAFENLEVIRKYLISPYVLPIISGDLSLYHQVTWRDFHHRLLKDSNAESTEAITRAKELAYEYERKVLPLQYRRTTPDVASYLQRQNIILSSGGTRYFSMYTLISWIEALLNERTNGFENSELKLPINSIRELSQLVFAFKAHIPTLHMKLQTLEQPNPSAAMLRRLLFMPIETAKKLSVFYDDYTAALQAANKNTRENQRTKAYRQFFDNQPTPMSTTHAPLDELATTAKDILLNHIKYDHKAGTVFLTLTADKHIASIIKTKEWDEKQSVFNTPLFQPLQHNDNALSVFQHNKQITQWQSHLKDRVPQSWLANLPQNTIIAYPTPEAGRAIKFRTPPNLPTHFRLLSDLLLHRNFYSINKQADLLCCGRIFELVMTSLIKDLHHNDIAYLIQRAPFYSLSAMASTKGLSLGSDGDTTDDEIDNEIEFQQSDDNENSESISQLIHYINGWRRKHQLVNQTPPSWLIYNIMNKFFNQVGLFNKPLAIKQSPVATDAHDLFRTARKAYRSLWAAFGSFEKGKAFGFPKVIASVNIGDGDDFTQSDLYKQNILPFLRSDNPDHTFGKESKSYTASLADHPLLRLIEEAYRHSALTIKEISQSTRDNSKTITEIIKRHLGLKSVKEIDNLETITSEDINAILNTATLREGIEHNEVNNHHWLSKLIEIYNRTSN